MDLKKQIRDFRISDKVLINKDFFYLDLTSNETLPVIKPGQFVEVLVEGECSVFLRRPFSVHDIDLISNRLTLLVQIVGHGTLQISKLNIGDNLNLMFPLGNSFTIPDSGTSLLIGGGCGIAPLLLLAKTMANNGIRPKILIGGRTINHLLRIDEYVKYGDVFCTTEDGSYGEKGYVIHHSILWKDPVTFNHVYSCGPEPMMKAVAKYARKRNIPCEVSLENTMACGIGACLCCVVKTYDGHRCVCTDGPVFNTDQLPWND